MTETHSLFQHLTVKQCGLAPGRAQRRRRCPYHKLQRKCTDSPAGTAHKLCSLLLSWEAKVRTFHVTNIHSPCFVMDCHVCHFLTFVILICSSRLRFCDLVFQGPLSVQEDWIKHLQRHIMNTSVPHTGLGMIEVASPPTTIKTEQDSSPTATHAAS